MELLSTYTLYGDIPTLIVATIAVALVGLSKGGLGGAFALLGVPVLALAMPPVQAAALLLPVLLMMDGISLWTWRGFWDRQTLTFILPPAIAGVAVGGLTAAVTSEELVRLLVGVVALSFVAYTLLLRPKDAAPAGHRPWLAWICGSTSGFTSFVAHAGGPPYQIYTLPLRMDPKVFTGTSVIFFALINAIKVIPYAALGQFDQVTVVSGLAMLPLAVLSTLLGAAVVRRMEPRIFYPFMYAMVTLVGLKLVWDGASALFI